MSCRKKFPATGLGSELCVALVLLSLQLVVLPLASAQRSKVTSKWQTLSGDAPLVIARGGFSGMFPDSSSAAYNLALLTSVPNVIFWCDVQLTKDAAGICFPDLKLDNSSDIRYIFNDKRKEYVVNGVRMEGLFSVDYTLGDLASVALNQGIWSRTNKFDGSLFPIQTVVDVFGELKPPATLWLNVQHDAFYKQHSLSMRNFVISVSKRVVINYISSPEVDFLRSIGSRFRSSTTKLVFRFLGENEFEPSSNQTYGSLLTNLTFIKTFASGIIVPKYFIQPVDPSLYLQACTSVVSDAHKEGLEVFASGFVNDYPLSFDYSYDPLSEQLAFIDNGNFSVDGVVTDFPVTASEAIDCFAHLGRKSSKQVELLVISKHGASGDYPACTNLAYDKAIRDGADVIDCLVQMSKDGTPFCLSSINLMESTNVLRTPFSNLTRSIPEIPGSGIFTFDIAWSDITKSLRPAISSPQADYKLSRNPKFKDAGAFVSLAEFLALAKNASSLSGVLIGIEHAAYLAEKEQLGVVDAVLDALSEAGYNKQTQKEVMIQSSDSSVLKIFKDKSNYKLGYKVGEPVRDILNGTVEDIKNFAHFVVVNKEAVFPENSFFVTAYTKVVPKLKSFKLPVYVETLSNEFTSQPWDFFSDPTVEINSFYMGAEIDGVITDFPKTAARYTRNRCLRRGERIPPYMTPVEPGTLIQIITDRNLPPAAAPLPVLREENVTEPPLPDVMKATPTSSPGGLAIAPAPASPRSQQPKIVICTFLSYLAVLFTLFLLVS